MIIYFYFCYLIYLYCFNYNLLISSPLRLIVIDASDQTRMQVRVTHQVNALILEFLPRPLTLFFTIFDVYYTSISFNTTSAIIYLFIFAYKNVCFCKILQREKIDIYIVITKKYTLYILIHFDYMHPIEI